MSKPRALFGLVLLAFGIAGFAVMQWRFQRIPDLLIQPDSLVVNQNAACGIELAGGVVCWGPTPATELGDLGEERFFQREGAVYFDGVDDATDLALTDTTACAARENGHVACWGSLGNLVDFTNVDSDPLLQWTTLGGSRWITDRGSAVPIAGLSDVAQIEGSRRNMCTRDTGGQIACTDESRTTPGAFDPIPQLHGAIDFRLSQHDVCALLADRSVACLPFDQQADAVQVLHRDAVWLDGGGSGTGLLCAGFADRAPGCWTNDYDEPHERKQFQASAFAGATGIFQRASNACAVFDGDTKCVDPQSRGLSATTDALDLISITGADEFVETGSSGLHWCASHADRTVTCAGSFGLGALGDAAGTHSSATPVTVATRTVPRRIRLLWTGVFATAALVGIGALWTSRRSRHASTVSS